VLYDGLNDQTTAEAEFRGAIEVDPGRGDGYAAMGDLLMRQEHYAEAGPWYAQAIDRNPGNRWWQYSRANAVRAAGDTASALSLYENSVAKFPDFGEAYFELALLQQASGDLNAAARSMDKALELMSAPIAWHFDQAGKVYAAASEWSRAADAYGRALGLDPSDRAAQAGLEQALAILGAATPVP
jgi:tetratricopeptide (TPR) repeat protein